MSIIRVKKDKDNPYLIINQEAIKRKDLSWGAKGLHTYLMSLPDDWKIYVSEVEKHAKDGRDALRTLFSELEKKAYVQKERVKKEDGKFSGYDFTV